MSSENQSAAPVSASPSVNTLPSGTGAASAFSPRVAVVPAAGFGTRLRPLTDSLPKEMLPLGRQTALGYIVSELQAAAIEQIVFVVSPAKEALLRSAFASCPGVRIHFAVQPEMRGLGDALLCATPYLDGESSFLVALGDAVFEEPVPGKVTQRLVHACSDFGNGQPVVGLAVQEVPLERVSRYGVVRPKGMATHQPFSFDYIVEKPAPEEAPSRYAAAARYLLPTAVLSALRETPADKKGEVQLTPALQTLLSQGYPGVAVPLQDDEVRHDIGNFDSYFRAFCTFALSDPDYGTVLGESLRAILATPTAPKTR